MERKNSLENTRRIGLRVDEDLHRELRMESVKTDKSMNLIIEELIRDYFRDRTDTDKTGI